MPAPFIAALLTPRGRGAVATIRLQGDLAPLDRAVDPLFRAVNGRSLATQEMDRILFGRWGRDAVEDVVLCRIDANTLEIHCHGGERAAERILADCRELGADVVDWKRLVALARGDLEAELQECLSRAVTWRTAEYLLMQASGLLRLAFERLAATAWNVDGRRAADAAIRDLLHWSRFGLHLTEPWRVVLTGPPNVGKSSLMNALLGYQRSIVFDQPGTTRDVVTGITAFEGWPVQLSDTAGLRVSSDELESEGMARARRHLAEADLILQLIDVSQPPADGVEDAEHYRTAGAPASAIPVLWVAHKCDLPDRWGDSLPEDATRVSSKTGAGVGELQRRMVRALTPEVPSLELPMPVTSRQIAALRSALAALAADDAAGYRLSISALTDACE
jgi:tRNA modification GTPase